MDNKSKKRSIPPSRTSGRPGKRAHISSKPSIPSQKRKIPITKLAVPDQSETDEEGGEPEEEVEVGADSNVKKTTSQSHKEQRVLRQQRLTQKPNGSLIQEAKYVWALARQQNIPSEQRQVHIKHLARTVRGKIKDVVFKHDASRVVQTLVRYGGQVERDQVASELKGSYKDLIQNKYSKFLVSKLIRHCPSHRSQILSEFRGHVIKLLLHREASQIISDAFELYANAEERNLLVQDFYGKEISLFDTTGTLEDILKDADQSRKKRALDSLKENLVNIFNNPDKGAAAHPIVHRALWEYLKEVNHLDLDMTGKERLRREMLESCQELIAEMIHTKDGSRAVRELLAWGNAKDRKQIIKVLKPHVERICRDEEAQLVLFTALDVVDDTKLLIKSVVSEIISCAPALLFQLTSPTPSAAPTLSKSSGPAVARRSVLYLLVPRSSRHFPPALVATISETDSIRVHTSKKEATVRQNEIKEGASEGFLKFISGETVGEDAPMDGTSISNAERLLRDPAGSLVLGEIMLYVEGDKSSAISAIIQPLIDSPYPLPPAPESQHPIDLAHSSRLYKTLIQGGHYDQKSKTISQPPGSDTESSYAFARTMMETIGKDKLIAFAKGNGAFVILELIERVMQDGTNEEKLAIKTWFTDPSVKQTIKDSAGRGQNSLSAKLDEL